MEKQDVLTALECCISHDGHSECSKCPYKHNITEDEPFVCSRLLYADVVGLLGGNADITQKPEQENRSQTRAYAKAYKSGAYAVMNTLQKDR